MSVILVGPALHAATQGFILRSYTSIHYTLCLSDAPSVTALSSEATVPFLRGLALRTSRLMSYLFNPLSLTIHLRVSIILSGGV
jgi:hypothetical protein